MSANIKAWQENLSPEMRILYLASDHPSHQFNMTRAIAVCSDFLKWLIYTRRQITKTTVGEMDLQIVLDWLFCKTDFRSPLIWRETQWNGESDITKFRMSYEDSKTQISLGISTVWQESSLSVHEAVVTSSVIWIWLQCALIKCPLIY